MRHVIEQWSKMFIDVGLKLYIESNVFMNLKLLGGRMEVLDLNTCPGVWPTEKIYPFFFGKGPIFWNKDLNYPPCLYF